MSATTSPSNPSLSFADRMDRMMTLALELTSQEWNRLGLDEINDVNPYTQPTSDKGVIIERITALFLARCVVFAVKNQNENSNGDNISAVNFKNIATSTVCQQLLDRSVPFPSNIVTETVVRELQEFVRRMIDGYKDVPYHNREHAFHVVLSVNKLIDMMVSGKNVIVTTQTTDSIAENAKQNSNGDSNTGSTTAPRNVSGKSAYANANESSTYVTYGLRHDPLALFSMLFAALIHDVEHQGIPNRQLALEDDKIAILYNDQSMAENYSLYLAFSELLKDDFKNLRKTILNNQIDDYRRLRRIVVDLVLSTDIASPERTQINKSKWKEAFGDPYESLERKMKLAAMQNNLSNTEMLRSSLNSAVADGGRRFSLTGRNVMAPRRASNLSTVSGVSLLGGQSIAMIGGDLDLGEHTGDDDESLSDTPEVSESGEDDNNNASSTSPMYGTGMYLDRPRQTQTLQTATMHGGMYSRSASMSFGGNAQGNVRRQFERRASAAASTTANSVNTAKYRQRLGILRTVDLSGETIETYARRGSMASHTSQNAIHSSGASVHSMPPIARTTPATLASSSVRRDNFVASARVGDGPLKSNDPEPLHANAVDNASQSLSIINATSRQSPETDYDADEPDELKASVVMAGIMTAADVAHNLQGWDHMVKWSSNLYLELRRAYVSKRGNDPSDRWFENQIGFLESYLLPLARRLEDTGVFHEHNIGLMFSSTVESNRDKWLTDGYDVAKKSIDDGIQKFPLDM